jgi:hypothetical protein
MCIKSSTCKIIVLQFVAIIFFGSTLCAQDISGEIEKYASKFIPERAFIHYDKSSYAPGETVWFKVYLMNELTPAMDSKSFYIDWIDDKGNLLQHTASPLVNGVTNGQYDIPVTYKGKYISARGYTSWMLNFDSAFLYTKTIPVFNKDSMQIPQKFVIKPTLEFFSEGGDAVCSIINKIAYKATDQWGRPVKIKGVIMEGGKVIDTLRTLHDGMGYLLLNPKPDIAYSAKWKDEKNVDYTTPLPLAKKEGLSLQVVVATDRRNFVLNFSQGFSSSIDSVYIVGTMYQHPLFQIAKSTRETATGTIPIKDLPYGVMTITVFDKSWKPLAERITYINNNAGFTFRPEMEVTYWGLTQRARNNIKIKVPEAFVSSLSISVTDIGIDRDSSNNIISSLMLTSELKGKVFNPAYYFLSNSEKVQQHLDLVMLTNGWRRFKWESVLSGNLPKINYPRDSVYMSLSGNLVGVTAGEISAGSTIMVMMKQKKSEGKFFLLPIMKNGSFNDPSSIIFDTAQIYYQIQDKGLKGSMVQFMPYKLRIPQVGKGWTNRILPDTSGSFRHWQMAEEANKILEKLNYKTLENVTVLAKAKPPVQLLDEKYVSGLFSGDGIQLDLVHDQFAKGAIDIFSYLQGKVAGLQITGTGSNVSMQWRGGSPQLYLDEMPTDINFVSSVNINDVAYVKIFRPPFMGGFNGANGAIAIYTRRGDDAKASPGKGLPGSKIVGYSEIREFYSPKYYSTTVTPEMERDVRTTLYWNPNISIGPAKKEVTISFNNNDVSKAFRIVIEGMTEDGKLAHFEDTME